MKIYRPFKNTPPIPPLSSNENIVPYSIISNFLSAAEVGKVLNAWDEEKAKDGKVSVRKHVLEDTEHELDHSQRMAREMFVDADNHEWLYDKIAMAFIMNNFAIFKYDILGFEGRIRLLKYGQEGFFDWHMDFGGANSNRKLVLCLQLSDSNEYEGGDLQLMTDKLSVPRTKGSAVIFPSYLMHRVTPITSGYRKSLVALAAGPPFR